MNSGKTRVLVADDDESAQRIFGFTLSEAGYDVSFASSGEDAFAALKTRSFDVAIVDIRMGGSVSGLIIAARGASNYPRTKIILATGLIGLSRNSAAVSGFPGSYATLFKPVEADHLLSTVEMALTS